MSLRSVDYASGTDLDWDIVPVILILNGGFIVIHLIIHITFNSHRHLNSKIYNEILKLHGRKRILCHIS